MDLRIKNRAVATGYEEEQEQYRDTSLYLFHRWRSPGVLFPRPEAGRI